MGDRLTKANQGAEKDLYMRLYTTLAKAIVVLKTPNKIFRNSLILNILELTQKIPALNFNDSEELNQIALDLTKQVSLISIEELRHSDGVYRTLTAEELSIELKNIEDTYIAKWGEL